MEFESDSIGKCIILKESDIYKSDALIYSIKRKEFIIASGIKDGSWLHGHYFFNLDDALLYFNENYMKGKDINEEHER